MADSHVPSQRWPYILSRHGVPWAPGLSTGGAGVGGTCGQLQTGESQTARQQHSRCQPHHYSLHNPGIILLSSSVCAGNTLKSQSWVHGRPFGVVGPWSALPASEHPPTLLPIPTSRAIHRIKLTHYQAMSGEVTFRVGIATVRTATEREVRRGGLVLASLRKTHPVGIEAVRAAAAMASSGRVRQRFRRVGGDRARPRRRRKSQGGRTARLEHAPRSG
jgi:hypothetical protein